MCIGPTASPASSAASTASVSGASVRIDNSSGMKRSRHSLSSASTTSSSWGTTSMSVNTRRDSISGRWVDDSECGACRKCERAFTLMNRRHHCRICGNIFCNSCSRTRMMIATTPGDLPKRLRVCDPCASHAQSSAILYDLDNISESDPTRRPSSQLSTEDASELSIDTKTTTTTITTTPTTPVDGPSVNFLMASMVCFAASFWFLKDEVSHSNPAIWILLAGFLKNLYQLIRSLRSQSHKSAASIAPTTQQQSQTERHIELKTTHKEKVHTHGSTAQPVKDENPLGWDDAKKKEMLALAHKTADDLYDLAMSKDNWTAEPLAFPLDDIVLHSRDGKPVRIYKCEAVFDLSAEELFDVLHGQFETSSSWNITAAENKILQRLSEDTDIVHVTSAPALGGMISSRDFINTRTWRKKDGAYVIGSTCAGKNLFKPVKGVTRGENGITGFVLQPHETSPFKCRMTWILNCDIKGYFPGSLIRKGSLSELCCFVRNLRRHLAATVGSDSTEQPPLSK